MPTFKLKRTIFTETRLDSLTREEKQSKNDKEELDELVHRLRQLTGIHSVDRYDTETV